MCSALFGCSLSLPPFGLSLTRRARSVPLLILGLSCPRLDRSVCSDIRNAREERLGAAHGWRRHAPAQKTPTSRQGGLPKPQHACGLTRLLHSAGDTERHVEQDIEAAAWAWGRVIAKEMRGEDATRLLLVED